MPLRDTVSLPLNVVRWRAPEACPPGLEVAEALVGRDLSDSDLRVVGQSRHLKYLDVAGSPIGDSGIENLESLQELEFLSLAACEEISDRGLAAVGNLGRLEVLDLSHCHRISDAGIAHLESLRVLRGLCLDACYSVTDAALSSLSTLPLLEEASLWSCEEISNEGIAALARVPSLRAVELPEFASIDDAGISTLVRTALGMTRLRVANLEGFTDNGMLAISTTSIEELAVSYCARVTDVGIESLAALPLLRRLTIKACPLVSDRGVAVLRARFPSASIEVS